MSINVKVEGWDITLESGKINASTSEFISKLKDGVQGDSAIKISDGSGKDLFFYQENKITLHESNLLILGVEGDGSLFFYSYGDRIDGTGFKSAYQRASAQVDSLFGPAEVSPAVRTMLLLGSLHSALGANGVVTLFYLNGTELWSDEDIAALEEGVSNSSENDYYIQVVG